MVALFIFASPAKIGPEEGAIALLFQREQNKITLPPNSRDILHPRVSVCGAADRPLDHL